MDPALALRLPLEVLDDVGQPDVALEDPDFRKAASQEDARRPHERPTPAVLDVAGLLAHHHDEGPGRSLAEDRSRGVPPQVTTPAVLDGLRQLVDGGVGPDERGRGRKAVFHGGPHPSSGRSSSWKKRRKPSWSGPTWSAATRS